MSTARRRWFPLLAAALAVALPLVLSAAPIRPLAAPLVIGNFGAINNTSYIEGDDYATAVLNNPWDMDSLQDIQFSNFLTHMQTVDGVLQMQESGPNTDLSNPLGLAGSLFPLFMNFADEIPWYARGDNPRYRIDAGKYTRLSYRLSTPSTIGPIGLYWWNSVPTVQQGRPFGAFDGRVLPSDTCTGIANAPWPTGFRVGNFDLTANHPPNWAPFGSWSGNLTQFRIDPYNTTRQTAPYVDGGEEVKLDWIRLTDPTSAPTITLDITGAPLGNRVGVWVRPAGSTDPNYTRAPIANVPSWETSISFPSSILPPGSWELRIGSYTNLGETCTIEDDQSDPVTIEIRPGARTEIVSPSMATSPDFSATVLGRPWTMASSSQLIPYPDPYGICQIRDTTNEVFSGGILSLTTTDLQNPPGCPPKPINSDGEIESDAHFFMSMTAAGGAVQQLNSSEWRYLVIRLKQNLPLDKDWQWMGRFGGGGRLTWFTGPLQAPVTSQSKFGLYVPGWFIYAVDLGAIASEIGPSWTPSGLIANIRYDLAETFGQAIGTSAANYEIDFLRITRMPSYPQGAFDIDGGIPISFVGHNIGPFDAVTGFYTTDRNNPTQNPANANLQVQPDCSLPGVFCAFQPNVVKGATAQPLDTVPTGTMNLRWTTASVNPGDYYFCIRTTTTTPAPGRVHTTCTDVPIRITAP